MKKLIFLALVAISLFSCKTEEPTPVFKTDPLATVDFKGVSTTVQKVKSLSDTVIHLSNLEIVKQTEMIKWVDKKGVVWTRMFDHLQRDTISTNPMLKLWASDILRYEELIDGTKTDSLILAPEFLEAKGCVLLNYSGKIIAYVPNSILRSAETQIKELFAAKSYESIYPVFNTAYSFIPITESEYAELIQ